VEAQPSAAYFGRVVSQREFSAALFGWGSTTGEPDSPLANILATPDPARGRGAYDPVRWSSPAFDAVLDRALATLDPAGREAAYREAMGLAMRDRRCCRCTAR
jgi:peptide/nickel transport system substrate-binding protein